MDEDKDYTYLKDKDFQVVTLRSTFQGMVAEIEPAIGATILDKENHTTYLYCLRGPSVNAKLFKKHPEVSRAYEKAFDLLVEQIERGHVILAEITAPGRNFPYLRRREASSETCPFN